MCGRTLHQICVFSVIEPVSHRKRTNVSYSSQDANASGTPQRGKKRVKICVRAEWRPVFTFSTNGELVESASSSGRKLRIAATTATARSAPRMPTCTCSPKVLFRQTT
jgi:hypothetical protein